MLCAWGEEDSGGLSEMTFRGLGIWDLGIIGLGFVKLGNN
jgi:hypothetical protein